MAMDGLKPWVEHKRHATILHDADVVLDQKKKKKKTSLSQQQQQQQQHSNLSDKERQRNVSDRKTFNDRFNNCNYSWEARLRPR